MSNIVLQVENLSKQYRLGLTGAGSLRDDVGRLWAKMRGKEDPTLKIGEANNRETIEGEYVWALQDINFEVKQGEVLGIIGKNGAGKSTLLKILSKVTAPTTGNIKVKGRIASLLEVGTGFHPELTGRENIFLNGAILGMTKNDIKSKFDEIVEFSGIGKYIDTPVKRYSSGMYVRLAFAVAAHLEPEILIIDEVLAVGDAEFQKKCLGKMKDVAGEGRTVLFVSHNMKVISSLCQKSIILSNGKIGMIGKTDEVISQYLQVNSGMNEDDISKYRLAKEYGKRIEIAQIQVITNSGNNFYGEDLKLKVLLKSYEAFNNLTINASIYNLQEISVLASPNQNYFSIEKNEFKWFEMTIKVGELLVPDKYLMAISVLKGSNISGYEGLDVIYGYPYIEIIALSNSSLDNNIANWNAGWGNIKLDSIVNAI